ncbi:MAG TPA: VWA domain-containing protein [Candidatus Hydrogenedentes bacterium]|nr:VWA domain-containing protein [Candidatus Hydrogenedentota bacterium]HRK34407.1 VWA domain-containing protein [Candidatus Hydrogenedentota bacterium]
MRTSTMRSPFANPMEFTDRPTVKIDVALMDESQSMEEIGFEHGSSKKQTVDKALKNHINVRHDQYPDDFLAIVGYSDEAELCCPLVNVRDDFRQLMAGLKAAKKMSGGTCIAAGLCIARDILLKRPSCLVIPGVNVITRVLAYSDGEDASIAEARRLATELKSRGVLIETFGIGLDRKHVDEKFLRQIASETNGFVHYRFLGDGDEVLNAFEELAHGTLTI